MEIIKINNKAVRARVIKNYLGNDRCFCFSCGNAVKELKYSGVNVIGISSKDKLKASEYITPK